jgi:hypothetical protein
MVRRDGEKMRERRRKESAEKEAPPFIFNQPHQEKCWGHGNFSSEFESQLLLVKTDLGKSLNFLKLIFLVNGMYNPTSNLT